MGIELPKIVVAGDPCPACFGPACPLGETTPKFVYITFKDIVKGTVPPCWINPPNDITFTVEQNPVDPCIWSGIFDIGTDNFIITYDADTSPGSSILLTWTNIWTVFAGTEALSCAKDFTNVNPGADPCCQGGTAHVAFEYPPMWFCRTANFLDFDGVKYDPEQPTNGNIWFPVAYRPDHSRMQVKMTR